MAFEYYYYVVTPLLYLFWVGPLIIILISIIFYFFPVEYSNKKIVGISRNNKIYDNSKINHLKNYDLDHYNKSQKESTFLGSNWGLIWRSIIVSFVSTLTLFIAFPWLMAWYYKWYYENIVIDNRYIIFTGKGKNMLFYYVFLLLMFLTLGIASFFMYAWLQRKTLSFVHLVDYD